MRWESKSAGEGLLWYTFTNGPDAPSCVDENNTFPSVTTLADGRFDDVKLLTPVLFTLNLLTLPTCKSIRSEPAAEAVSVTFIFTAVNVVPPAFQVSVRL